LGPTKYILPEDGDRIQPPKCYIKTGGWRKRFYVVITNEAEVMCFIMNVHMSVMS
jgi:hypothetical protein